MEFRLAAEAERCPAKMAIKLIALFGDNAELQVYRMFKGMVKDTLLECLKNRRVQLYNLRGYDR